MTEITQKLLIIRKMPLKHLKQINVLLLLLTQKILLHLEFIRKVKLKNIYQKI